MAYFFKAEVLERHSTWTQFHEIEFFNKRKKIEKKNLSIISHNFTNSTYKVDYAIDGILNSGTNQYYVATNTPPPHYIIIKSQEEFDSFIWYDSNGKTADNSYGSKRIKFFIAELETDPLREDKRWIEVSDYSNANPINALIEIQDLGFINKTLLQYGNENVGALTDISHGISTPKMTSNSTPYGKAFASAESGKSNEAWKVFNQVDGYYSIGVISTQIEGYLGYIFLNKKKVCKYAIGSPPSNTSLLKSMPKTWIIEGSNDTVTGNDGTWTLIDRQENQTWSSVATIKEYLIKNPEYYRSYRIRWLDNNGGSYINIADFIMYEVIDLPHLTYLPEINEEYFLRHGIQSTTTLSLDSPIDLVRYIEKSTTVVGNGISFSKRIDTNKTPIKQVSLSRRP